MADITITIPDAILGRVLDGVSKYHDYDGSRLPSETKAQFGKRMIHTVLRKWVIASESSDASDTQVSATGSELTIT